MPLAYSTCHLTVHSSSSRFSYASLKDLNPFCDENTHFPCNPPRQDPQPPRMHDPVKVQNPHGIPQSHSEGSLRHLDHRGLAIVPTRHIPPTLHEDLNEPLFDKGGRSLRSPSRGRGAERMASPIKVLQDVHEEDVLDILQSPRKRSRSPHKRLFGEGGWLSKSTSLKELSHEPSKRGGLKIWGDKLKSRVEDLVWMSTP